MMQLKKIIVVILLGVIVTLPLGVIAQKVYTQTLTTDNYLDSNLMRKYRHKIDTHRIKIEVNHVIGLASFYSKNLNGTLTSTGERFQNKKYTAASNLYELNTIVRVTNLRNGHSVLVRINDRMAPSMLKKGRVIDLSRVAAKSLKLNGNGIVKVAVDAIGHSKLNPKASEQTD
jgi:rare lipoprotein A (peptidoglycan hydrolase)